MQNRSFVGFGPSLNKWPRCESHRAQRISVRTMPWLKSGISRTFSDATGWKKLG